MLRCHPTECCATLLAIGCTPSFAKPRLTVELCMAHITANTRCSETMCGNWENQAGWKWCGNPVVHSWHTPYSHSSAPRHNLNFRTTVVPELWRAKTVSFWSWWCSLPGSRSKPTPTSASFGAEEARRIGAGVTSGVGSLYLLRLHWKLFTLRDDLQANTYTCGC